MITKPMIVDVPSLTWDALELLELLQEKAAAGEQPKVREMKQLVALVFTDWTLDDAGKITQAETKQVFDSIMAAFQDTPPKESAGS